MPKPIKWEDIKIGQDYYTQYNKSRRFTKLGNMRVRGRLEDGTYHDFDIQIISKSNHYLWKDKIKLEPDCKHCKWLEQLFSDDKIESNREYWIMTEIFVYLHDGKDYCNGGS